MMISFCFGLYAICAFAGLGFGLCYVGVCTIGRSALPTSVKFPGLKTFRDISKVIAAGAR